MTTETQPARMGDELLPCPFCGSDARLEAYPTDEDSTHWVVKCFGCGATNGDDDADSTPDQEFATTAWNTRTSAASLRDEGDGEWRRGEGAEYVKGRPTTPSVYRVRGYHFGHPNDSAVVEVEIIDGHLCCNLHEVNSAHEADRWSRLSDISHKFEWKDLLAPATQPAAQERQA